MSHGDPRRFGGDRFARAGGRARRPGSQIFLHHSTNGHADFCHTHLFRDARRSNPPAHKRLIFVGTTALLIAAIARWPFAFVNRKAPVAALVSYSFLPILVAYDLWSTRKVHRATIWAGASLIFVQQIRLPIGNTAAWHTFAGWVQSLAR